MEKDLLVRKHQKRLDEIESMHIRFGSNFSLHPRNLGEPFCYQEQINKTRQRNSQFKLKEQNAEIVYQNQLMLKKLVNVAIGRTARNMDTGLPSPNKSYSKKSKALRDSVLKSIETPSRNKSKNEIGANNL